jgi:hypothetical protein
MKKAARQYDIVYSTLYNQIHESTSFEESRTARQRLSPGEEQAMKIWLLQLAEWGWPCRRDQLRGMAMELLIAKGDTEELGVH